MRNFWRKIKIKHKILTIGILLISLFSISIYAYFIPEIEKIIFERKKEKIQDLGYIVYATIENYHKQSQMGQISKEQAQSAAAYMINNFRFGPDKEDHFQVFTKQCRIIVDPYHRENEGKILKDFKNIEGQQIYKHMADIASTETEGFYSYKDSYKFDVAQISNKIAFVKYFEEWEWVITTSVYTNDIEAEINTFYAAFSLVTAIIFSSAVLIIFIIAKAISNPILQINNIMKDADLNTELNTPLKDEIGVMVQQFNNFIKQIRHIVLEIRASSENLAASSEEMSAVAFSFAENAQDQSKSSQTITRTVKEITHEMDQVNKDIDSEFESLEELVSKMDELSTLISIVDTDTEKAMNKISLINENAASGDDYLKKMSLNIEKVSKSSEEMHNIIAIINDISEQINLLSLNAAIEAARAGETGRGFAVVSDEISKLADETANSIKNIVSIINENEKEITNAKEQVQLTVKEMSSIITGVNSIREMIAGISDKMKQQVGTKESLSGEIQEIKNMSNGIRMTTKVQKIAVNEINDMIIKINEGNTLITSGSEELTASSEEVAGMAEKLKQKVDIFKI